MNFIFLLPLLFFTSTKASVLPTNDLITAEVQATPIINTSGLSPAFIIAEAADNLHDAQGNFELQLDEYYFEFCSNLFLPFLEAILPGREIYLNERYSGFSQQHINILQTWLQGFVELWPTENIPSTPEKRKKKLTPLNGTNNLEYGPNDFFSWFKLNRQNCQIIQATAQDVSDFFTAVEILDLAEKI